MSAGLFVLIVAAALGIAATARAGESDLKKLSLDQLMAIEVTSVSRQPEKLIEAPSAIQVITAEEIHRSGAVTIPEALRLADNLDVAQKNSHDWGISARGFNTELANKLLVMIDGRTLYTPLFSGVVWDAQDYLLDDLERVEVVSGPGGSVWGANAVNGVINIISKSAEQTQGLQVTGAAGDPLDGNWSARYGGKLGANTFYRVYGKFIARGNEALPDGRDYDDEWRRRQGGFRIDSQWSARDSVTLQGDTYAGHNDLPDVREDSTRGHNIVGRWTRTLSPESGLQLQIYYDRTHLAAPKTALIAGGNVLAPAGTFKDDLDTYDLDFQHRLTVARMHKVVWGLGYRHARDVTTNAPSLGFLPSHRNLDLYSGFLQDEIALRSNLSLIAGTKIEHNDYTGFELEPNVRLKLDLTPVQTIWSAISRAIRAPSRIDRDLTQGTPPYFRLLAGSEDFNSENVVAYELGWRMRVGSLASGSLSAFYNRYDDIRSTALDPKTIFPLSFHNDVEGETHGLELSTTVQARDWWRLHAGYTALFEHLQIKPGGADINNALNETSDPKHRISLRSSMDLPHRVETDLNLRWVDKRPSHAGATPGSLPSYVELDARLGWHASDHLELSLVGQNLLHDQHAEYGFPAAARAEIRRSVFGSATWRY